MSIKLAGCSTLLVRAVEMDGTEVGMTAWAQMTASLGGAPNMCSKAVKRGSELSHQYMRCESGDPEGSKR
jgi:hypothetical protein